MNIFLAKENWLDEVKGMVAADIFSISHNTLPDIWKKTRGELELYVLAVVQSLPGAGSAVQLSVGDFNK